jgi:hypothetical protein
VKYGNGGFIPEHAGHQFSEIKLTIHTHTVETYEDKGRRIVQNTKQSQESIKMVCKFRSHKP